MAGRLVSVAFKLGLTDIGKTATTALEFIFLDEFINTVTVVLILLGLGIMAWCIQFFRLSCTKQDGQGTFKDVFTLIGSFFIPLRRMPGYCIRPRRLAPLGDFALGCFRTRLPPPPGLVGKGLFAQVHYPANLETKLAGVGPVNWLRDEVLQEIAKGYSISLPILRAILGGVSQVDPAFAPCKAIGAESGGWPIVVFSHGLFGSCEMYTQLCREVASCGAIVIAIEHEDGSSVYARNATTDECITYINPPGDVDPNDNDAIATFRHPFLEKRIDELRATAAALIAMTEGSPHMRAQSAEGAALESVLRCGDPDRLLLVGHSFGAAGIARYLSRLRATGETCPFQGAILIDIWGQPLVHEDLRLGLQIPYTLLQSENWGRGEILKKFMEASAGMCLGAAFVSGTNHQWISETSYFAPKWLLRKMGLMGRGDFMRTHHATAVALRLSLRALLTSGPRHSIYEDLALIDGEILSVF